MKHFMTSITKHKLAALGALALSATLSAQAASHDLPTKAFRMAYIVDEAHGRKVAFGNYGAAIEKITAGNQKMSDVFSGHVNLCVAYAKTKEIKKARAACDAAVAYMKKRESQLSGSKNKRNPELRALRTDLSIALSNRGVLLATTGDTELAKKDFIAAMSFRTPYSKIAAANLDRLAETAVADA